MQCFIGFDKIIKYCLSWRSSSFLQNAGTEIGTAINCFDGGSEMAPQAPNRRFRRSCFSFWRLEKGLKEFALAVSACPVYAYTDYAGVL